MAAGNLTAKLTAALRNTRDVEPQFLEHWSEEDKTLFREFVADQEALHKHLPLSAIDAKVARQSALAARYPADKCCVTDGKLSVAALLHATLKALHKCQLDATRKKQAERQEKLSKAWLQRPLDTQRDADLALQAQAEHEKPSECGKIMFTQDLQQAKDSAFRVRNKATPAPATKKPNTDRHAGSAKRKHKGGAKDAAEAVSPQLGAKQRKIGHHCDGCQLHFPASELNFSSVLHFLVCEKCELILAPEGPAATAAAATEAPLPPAALAVPPGAGGSSAAAMVTNMEPGSARRAAAAVLAAVAPGGLPLSEVLQRALALGLFTPQLPVAGGSADVSAWAEMSAALLSEDIFMTLSPGVFALRSLVPRDTKGLQRPATVPAAPVATLSANQLRARLKASRTLRSEAEALLHSAEFHRTAREARAAGDATALARHFATIHPERELARSPEVYLALANGNYEGVELEMLWRQISVAAAEMGQRALEVERQRRIAAESRALEAIERAVAAEAREAAVSRRAVAIVRRAHMDPYDLLSAHDAEAGEVGGASYGDDDEAAVDPPTAGVQEPDVPPAGDGARASSPVPAAREEDVRTALPPPGADAAVTGDAPPEPSENAMPETAAAAAGGGKKGESSHLLSEDAALDLPAAAAEEVVQQAAPLQTGGGGEPKDDDWRKRVASELPAAEEPLGKAALVDEPPPAAPPSDPGSGDAAAAEECAMSVEELKALAAAAALKATPQHAIAYAQGLLRAIAAAAPAAAAAAVHLGEEELDTTAAPAVSPGGIDADCAAAPVLTAPSDNAPPADIMDSIMDSTAGAAPVAPEAADPASAEASQIASQLLSGQMCLCNAVLADSVARGDVMVNCSTCAQPFHPACCGYPASLSGAAAAAMRPLFACYDHHVYFPPSQQYE